MNGAGEVLYIGLAARVESRTFDHERNSQWFDAVKTIEVLHFANRGAARLAERELILAERPPFNCQYLVEYDSPTAARRHLTEGLRKDIQPILAAALQVHGEKDLAKKIGVSPIVLSNFMRDEIVPAMKTFDRLSAYFKIQTKKEGA
jgi:hypothetical protein